MITIVSLFVLTGYGFDLFGECCAHREVTQTENGKSGTDNKEHKAPGKEDGCQCICHHFVTPLTPEPTRIADAVFILGDFMTHADEFPPDAVPLGIDYPPQLA